MENIGGIFVVLICGLIVAIFMAMLEFLWTLRHSEATEVNLQRGTTYSVGRWDHAPTNVISDKTCEIPQEGGAPMGQCTGKNPSPKGKRSGLIMLHHLLIMQPQKVLLTPELQIIFPKQPSK